MAIPAPPPPSAFINDVVWHAVQNLNCYCCLRVVFLKKKKDYKLYYTVVYTPPIFCLGSLICWRSGAVRCPLLPRFSAPTPDPPRSISFIFIFIFFFQKLDTGYVDLGAVWQDRTGHGMAWHGVAWHGMGRRSINQNQSDDRLPHDPCRSRMARYWRKCVFWRAFCLEAPEHRKPSPAICRILALLLSHGAPPSPYIVYDAYGAINTCFFFFFFLPCITIHLPPTTTTFYSFTLF